MATRIISKSQQAYGAFNGGQIIENKPIGFPREGGFVRPYSNLFYWARAEAVITSTIGLHPHQGFEILSFVLDGEIHHYDTKTDAWAPLHAGDVQIIRAGSGIQHAERMEKGGVMFQIWLDPDLSKTLSQPASYSDYRSGDFPIVTEGDHQVKTLIGEGSPLRLDTSPIEVKRHTFSGKIQLQVRESEVLSLYLIEGSGNVDGQTLEQDDFVIVDDKNGVIEIEANSQCDLFAIRNPAELEYHTYAQRAGQYA